jgi:hypothetical protein
MCTSACICCGSTGQLTHDNGGGDERVVGPADPQLAEEVPTPAHDPAAGEHHARVFAAQGDGGDSDAWECNGGVEQMGGERTTAW